MSASTATIETPPTHAIHWPLRPLLLLLAAVIIAVTAVSVGLQRISTDVSSTKGVVTPSTTVLTTDCESRIHTFVACATY